MRAIALALLLTAHTLGAEPRVAYSLHAYAPGTSTPIESVKAGQEFDLAMMVQDKRQTAEGMRRGVFAGYANLQYPKRYAAAQWLNETEPFYNPYRKQLIFTASGLGPWGGYAGFRFNGEAKPQEVSRVRFKAAWPATIDPSVSEAMAAFRLNHNGLVDLRYPKFNTLLYGNPGDPGTVLPDEITAAGVTVRITK